MRRSVRILSATAAGGLAVIAALGVAPAAYASSGYIGTPNGMAGFNQTVTIYAPQAKGKKVGIKVRNWYGAPNDYYTTINKHGYGSLLWMPPLPGSYSIEGIGMINDVTSQDVTAYGAPSYMLQRSPDTVQAGVPTSTVADLYEPLGLTYGSGDAVLNAASGFLGANYFGAATDGADQSASISWTPSTAGASLQTNLTFTGMTHYPAAAPPTSSGTATINVTASPVPVAIRSVLTTSNPVPVGIATPVDAVLGSGFPDGTVTWSLDGVAITGPLPTANGVSTLSWTPPTTGAHSLSVAYAATAADGTPTSGSASVSFTVGDAPAPDGITVTPAGQAPWSTTKAPTMANGSKLTLRATTQSGTPVQLSETGPCVLVGNVLRTTNTGTCYVTASVAATQFYLANKQTYPVRITAS